MIFQPTPVDMELFGRVREIMEEASKFCQRTGYIASEDANKVIRIVGDSSDREMKKQLVELLENRIVAQENDTDFTDFRLNDDEWKALQEELNAK